MSKTKNLPAIVPGDEKFTVGFMPTAPSGNAWRPRAGAEKVPSSSTPVGTKGISDNTYDWDKADTVGKKSKKGGEATSKFVRCYESHPALPLNDGLVIYGGSCTSPIVTDADVYVALEPSWRPTKKSWPWVNKAVEVCYPITDMDVPASSSDFKSLIDYVVEQLKAGKKVHVGCIGGHGRTGMVLAAVVKVMMGNEDAITYVREKYCKKAVETNSQVAFLHANFGIKKVAESKPWGGGGGAAWKGGSGSSNYSYGGLWENGKYTGGSSASSASKISAPPMAHKMCIWGPNAIDK